jgi:hypothetical protein
MYWEKNIKDHLKNVVLLLVSTHMPSVSRVSKGRGNELALTCTFIQVFLLWKVIALTLYMRLCTCHVKFTSK